MLNQINSNVNFKATVKTDIVFKNPQAAERFKNIQQLYAEMTNGKKNKDLFMSEQYDPIYEKIVLKIFGSDTFVSHSLDNYLNQLSDADIAKKLYKIADYLSLKNLKRKKDSRYLSDIVQLEGKSEANRQKSKLLLSRGNEKFAVLCAKIAELNAKTAERYRREMSHFDSAMDEKVIKIADGDKEILDDILI